MNNLETTYKKESQEGNFESAPSVAEERIKELAKESNHFAPEDKEDKAREIELLRAEIMGSPSIEQQANFMGNYAELLFLRMNNPVIREQLLNLVEENENYIADHPDTETVLKRDPLTSVALETDDGMPIFERVPGKYSPKTRQQIEREINIALQKESAVTVVDFKKPIEGSSAVLIDTNGDWNSPENGEATIGVDRGGNNRPLSPYEIRDYSLTEAHEKGHVFRPLRGSEYLRLKFSVAFDVSKVTKDAFFGKGILPLDSTDEEIKEELIDGYLFNFYRPIEIIERMSQLKNYFGMKGSEKFTSAHLDYAREHYVKDVTLENHMQAFFDAITPQTEEKFLALINSIGV